MVSTDHESVLLKGSLDGSNTAWLRYLEKSIQDSQRLREAGWENPGLEMGED